MTRLIFKFMPALVMAAATACGAQAACATFTTSDIDVTYDPLGTQGTTQVYQTVQMTATAQDDNPAGVTAQFVDQDNGSTLRIGTRGPIYSITSPGKVVVVGQNAVPLNPSNTFSYAFPSQGTGAVNGLYFIIDPDQNTPAGVFSEELSLQFQCTGSTGMQLQSAGLHVSVHVPSTLIVSLAGSSASGTLDFAYFAELTKTALVNVYSTGPYALSVTSDNGQTMKLVNAPAGAAANTQIGYTLSFDGVPVPTGATTGRHFGATGIGGAQLPLAVTAEPISTKRAGTYHDTITLTFTPLTTL